eukprot:CAMPEP_0171161536 /NCGR_PEP_ID=MMETSP0790-20130122/4123_1 /TAXON_ID=2925 /ORGANISM="Alexandrium catenella, Strain OF101" /LENGTH=54 /DNA_ID=CAMNT_0011626103 /DNA_START=478 /DNA_END=640 /DNA_ORIENTATION=-
MTGRGGDWWCWQALGAPRWQLGGEEADKGDGDAFMPATTPDAATPSMVRGAGEA